MLIPVVVIYAGIILCLYLLAQYIQGTGMNLIIDAGNSQIKWAIYSKNQQLSRNSYQKWSEFQFKELSLKYPEISHVMISSVRTIPINVYDSLKNSFPQIIELDHKLKLPISIKYKTPETLGKDRIAAAVGGQAKFPGLPVLVIDLGTAITLDMINERAEFIGGNISPGMNLRYKALGSFTDDLPMLSSSQEVPFLGQTTTEAIQSGVQQGITFEIEAYIKALISKYNELRIILTGGDASVFVKNLKNTIFVVPNLVLDGLNLILEFQKRQS